MKKLATLLFALGIFSASFAQSRDGRYSQPDPKSVILGQSNDGRYGSDDRRYDDRRYDNSNTGYNNDRNRNLESERAAQVQRLNREFDYRIQAVRNNRRLKNKEQSRQIRSLEAQRADEIRQLNNRFAQTRNGYDNNPYARNNNRY